jgi:hypothetical protein
MYKSHGFRISLTDGLFIAVNLLAAALLYDTLAHFVWLFPIAVGHFFLFCNVFRIRRSYELVWTAVFIANVAVWLYLAPTFHWLGVLAVQTPLTAILIGLEIRSDRYHGIFSRPG